MIYRSKLIDRLEPKLRWLAIPNLMLILVGAMAIVFIMNLAIAPATGHSLSEILYFDRDAILQGQVWRIATFLFLPPNASLLFIALSLYLYWLIGSALENAWGSFGFTVYYLLGAVGAILAGCITGAATNEYLNLSLFFAFAMLNPDFELLLFFFIPVKMKWLAILDAAGFLIAFIFGSASQRIALLFAVLNVLIFFTPQAIGWVKSLIRRWQWNRKIKK